MKQPRYGHSRYGTAENTFLGYLIQNFQHSTNFVKKDDLNLKSHYNHSNFNLVSHYKKSQSKLETSVVRIWLFFVFVKFLPPLDDHHFFFYLHETATIFTSPPGDRHHSCGVGFTQFFCSSQQASHPAGRILESVIMHSKRYAAAAAVWAK